MQQFRNSDSSLLSSIMGPNGATLAKVRETGKSVTSGDIQDVRTSAKSLAAERSAASIRKGPQVPRGGGSYGRAVRRQRKAGRANRTEKVQKQTAILKQKRERVLDTAAAFARIWFAGPPVEQKKGVSAYARVAQRVEKQVKNLLDTGKASDRNDAIEQIEDSMRETIRQHEVLLAAKLVESQNAAKQAQMDALRSRLDARTGHPVVG